MPRYIDADKLRPQELSNEQVDCITVNGIAVLGRSHSKNIKTFADMLNQIIDKTGGRYIEVDENRKPTNFEVITQSVESLAEFLAKIMICDDCPIRLQSDTCKRSLPSPCSEIIKEWLQKESE